MSGRPVSVPSGFRTPPVPHAMHVRMQMPSFQPTVHRVIRQEAVHRVQEMKMSQLLPQRPLHHGKSRFERLDRSWLGSFDMFWRLCCCPAAWDGHFGMWFLLVGRIYHCSPCLQNVGCFLGLRACEKDKKSKCFCAAGLFGRTAAVQYAGDQRTLVQRLAEIQVRVSESAAATGKFLIITH